MIAAPFSVIRDASGYYVIAPSVSDKAHGPYTRQEARRAAMMWNKKYEKAERRELERKEMREDAA